MKTHVRVATAAVLIAVGLTTGCTRTTTGTVAQTTEPAPPVPDALSVTCQQYGDLDEAAQQDVIEEILAQDDNPLGRQGEEIAKTLAETVCQFLPDATVNEVLLGDTPP